jgi:hypothetical protein
MSSILESSLIVSDLVIIFVLSRFRVLYNFSKAFPLPVQPLDFLLRR